MPYSRKAKFGIRLFITAVLSLCGIAFIAYLSINVVRDLRLLNTAHSDNVQWTLSQSEVEHLAFELRLNEAVRDSDPNLKALRRQFDIFYSRIKTIREGSIFAPVRALPEFGYHLANVQDFLDDAVQVIDADDAELTRAIPDLVQKAGNLQSSIRGLSNSGLTFFALESDQYRETVSVTLTQLAIGVTVLLLALVLLVIYLERLNRQNIRRRREAIQASQRFNVVTSTALDAVIVCDVAGRVLEFNDAAEQIFGYTTTQAIGNDLGALIVPDHFRDAHEAGMQRMRENGQKRVVGKGRIKLEGKRANGEVFPVELAIQSAETDEGEVFISFLRDISHRVAAEAELVAARDRALAGEKEKTDFLATMSHEIRTPLNGLLGNLTLLQDTGLTEKQTTFIKNMNTSGKLLMSHISDVLDITKYDAGKLQLRPVVMNLSTLLQDIVDNQGGAAAARNTTLEWSWDGPVNDWIYADKERIQHMLMNVIGNAVKFTRDGEVFVRIKSDSKEDTTHWFEITVSDTGIGIPDDMKGQIFDDFMTGDASYGREVGGTGLGLGIAKRFVTAMGGTIKVESQEGKGSQFIIHFPATPVEAVRKPKGAPERPATVASLDILLVEDNEMNRFVAREMLNAQGHRVTEAHNGQIAVDLCQKRRFDLVLMDISMPVMDGRAATRAIRSSDGPMAEVPIVALTANAMADEQNAFLSDGMNDIITKPLSRDNLFDVLRQFTPHAPAQRDAHETNPHIVDQTHMQEVKDTLGADMFQSLVDRFCKEVDETLAILSQDHPHAEVASHAHKVAGSAAMLGVMDLRQALIAVENAAKQEHAEQLQTAIAALPAVWAKTRPLVAAQPAEDEAQGLESTSRD